VVVIVGFSIPFLWKTLVGGDTGELTEDQRLQAAVKEANASLRRIADQHGVQPQELSSAFSGGARKPAPAPAGETPDPTPPTGGDPAGEEPKSAIEKEIEKVEEGPEVPPIPAEEEVDLFR
jgi:hypothetical protein